MSDQDDYSTVFDAFIKISDLVIVLSYFAIPLHIFYVTKFLPKRFPYMKLIYLFVTFTTWCGITHLTGILFNYEPTNVVVSSKVITAIISVAFTIVMLKIMPKAFSLSYRVISLEEELDTTMRNEENLMVLNGNLHHLRQLTHRIRRSLKVKDVCDASCTELCHRITCIDEVMMFLQRDETSEIVAKSCQSDEPCAEYSLAIPSDHPLLQRCKAEHRLKLSRRDLEDILSGFSGEIPESGLLLYLELQRIDAFVLLCSAVPGWTITERDSVFLEDASEQIKIALQQALDLENETIRLQQLAEQYERCSELEKAKEEAEALVKIKGEFLATISHELRTPMNAIIGFVDLLLVSTLTAEQRETLEIVEQSSCTLLNLLNNLLDVKKLEFYGDQFQLDETVISIREVLEHAVDLLYASAETKGLQLNYFADDTLPEQIIGDKTRLRQVLVNFLSNAIKFTENGEVSISVSTKEPPLPSSKEYPICRFLDYSQPTSSAKDALGPQQTIYIQVVDTGIGVPEDSILSLFQKFKQVDSSFSRRYHGTGLGLAICSKLIQLHKGKIWVQSKPGKGTIFTVAMNFKLTTYDEAIRPAKEYSLIKSHLPRDIIVVVDNFETSRKAIAQLVDLCNGNALTFETCAEAFTHIKTSSTKPVAIIVDEESLLQSQTDITFAKQLAQLSSFILIQKSISFHEDINYSPLLGKKYYRHVLHKPLKKSVLRRVLGEAIVPGKSPEDSSILAALQTQPERDLCSAHSTFKHGILDRIKYSKILCVDDNPTNRLIALKLLQYFGFQNTILAETGLEATRIVAEQQIDILLMDINMPGMSGIDATDVIRRQSNGQSPYIVAMTASVMMEEREICLQHGMNDFLPKPINRESLFAVLKRYLQYAVQKAED
ncbi:hypothetical protein BKA69DRAFT_1124702 [Paraphysoderma sedebokerense]|nr:hypothetical protein BKA69DRAFT_1124702 [Paraphysoderma sedebokerense]